MVFDRLLGYNNTMRRLLNKLKSELFLRLGLSGVLIYSGWGKLTEPINNFNNNWPDWTTIVFDHLDPEQLFQVFGAFELVLGVAFLVWFMSGRVVRWAAILASIYFLAWLGLSGLTATTYYYWGLAGLSLATWSTYRRRY